MPIYHRLGEIKQKRHTIYRKKDNSLYQEELFGTIGFDGMSSILYHENPPTKIKWIKELNLKKSDAKVDVNIQPRKFKTSKLTSENDFLNSRKSLMKNNNVEISICLPKTSVEYFYKNADCDELYFVHRGKGKLFTQFGYLDFKYGDFLLIPRGSIYRFEFENTENKFLLIESKRPIYTPKRYRNWFGQLLEHSPYCERDIQMPKFTEAIDQEGEFIIKTKKQSKLFDICYAHHPFDVVGWDGYNYPWSISIFDFEPITGRIHQPPPVHQIFETDAFVVCAFVPRLYDYHPESIPAPYHHSNIDSDEVLYYVDGDFMSRNDIDSGDISLHPAGIPHGPHPGAIERSIGKKGTEELAVMIDTFNPLSLTMDALLIEDESYINSWL